MKGAWIYILAGVALLSVASNSPDSEQVQQKLAGLKSQIQMARLVMPVLRSAHDM